MKLFIPDKVIFSEEALKYPLATEMMNKMRHLEKNIDIIHASPAQLASHIPSSPAMAKRVLYVTVNRSKKLAVCRPSADYEFDLAVNCPGNCEYCYLQSSETMKPYVKAFINMDEIFETIEAHMANNPENITVFEAASHGDPLSLEHLTGTLQKSIGFFAHQKNGRMRVVTKFPYVEPLLNVEHNGHTHFRFSVNSQYVIEHFEHNTSTLEERLQGASRVAAAGYPAGFIIAPLYIHTGWQQQYEKLFEMMKEAMSMVKLARPLTFELIQHRFTDVSKERICRRFPNTSLDFDMEQRQIKWGKFGRQKYVYRKEVQKDIRETITMFIQTYFPDAVIEYFT